MYAVFEDGSRQYRVAEGDILTVDYREAEVGTRLEFNRVLIYRSDDETRLGQPLIEGLRVLAEVVDHPSTKYYIQKFRKRKNSRRFRGHRQWYTKVQVKHILLPGAEPPAAPPPAEKPVAQPAAQVPATPPAQPPAAAAT